MFYQLRANLYFQTTDHTDDIMDKILDHFDDTCVINPGTPEQECSEFQLLENHHDADPNQPCFLIITKTNSPA